jgi:two-component system, chemotaxis family, sensor kinase CheA
MSTAGMMDDDMKEIFESFVIETRELLDTLSTDLMLLESEPNDLDLMNRIFRSVHTIKGTSGFMGFEQVQTITHKGEDLLNKLRKGELSVSQDIIDALLEVYDWVTLLLNNIEQGNTETVDFQKTIDKLILLNNGSPIPAQTTPSQDEGIALPSGISATNAVLSADFGKGTGDDFTAEEEALLQAAFAELNSQFTANSSRDIKEESPVTKKTKDSVLSASAKAIPETEPQPTQQAVSSGTASKTPKSPDKPLETKSASNADTTIRVDIGRVETLMNLSGELVLGRNRLQQLAEKLFSESENNQLIRELVETAAQVDFVTSEIQTSVMRMRMIPIAKLYQKAPRMVRDICKEIHKEIELELHGEETELDRTIIEELNDPLIHMIRNACDHGVETPAEREAAGKPRKGKVVLDAEQVGNHIIITISDDGKGMDPDKLKQKAVEKGLITQEQAQVMSNKEAYQLIFAPGFSTAQVVSNISGRGVGMDVVRTNIQKLKGVIDIDSVFGEGTTFTIKLPLTLAIIQGLLVKVSNEVYTIPLSSVVEVVGFNNTSINYVNQRPVLRIREQVLPILWLDKALGVLTETPVETAGKYVVIVGVSQHRLGIVVDELLGQQEIVIKSLGQYLGQIPGITGSTILGDGSVVMIIDIGELIEAVQQRELASA